MKMVVPYFLQMLVPENQITELLVVLLRLTIFQWILDKQIAVSIH